ncbi:MAG: hypothetical protein AB8B91_09270 [Rubripirellula sp.]
MPTTPRQDSAHSLAANAWVGYLVAPLCVHFLFAASMLLCDLSPALGISRSVQELVVFTLTFGLAATYFLFGLIGLPTAYVLHRMSVLNLWSVNVAAIVWSMLLISLLQLVAGAKLMDLLALDGLSSILAGVAVMLPFVLLLASTFFLVATKKIRYRFSIKSLLIVIAITAASLSSTSLIRNAIQPRVVACTSHPSGARLMVTQEWGGEPFDTSIFFDDGDGNWRWYYYDHEDWYWGSAECQIVGDAIRVSSTHRSIVINTQTGECSRARPDGRDWTTAKSNRASRRPPVSVETIDRLTWTPPTE